jgi:hypothetical protein
MSVLPLSKRRVFVFCVSFVVATASLFFYWQNRVKPITPQFVHFGQLTLERTGCLGSCPVYTVTIDRDGHVTYRAPVFHPTPQGAIKGSTVVRQGRMPENVLRVLIAAVESPEYSRLESTYALDVTDMPGTEIKVSGQGLSTQTYVYAVPCEKDAKADSIYWKMKALLQSGTEVSESPPVPDIFCTVEELADIGSCARYWGQDSGPFGGHDVPPLPTPARCKATP